MAYTITQKERAEENMIFSDENQENFHSADKIKMRTERGRLNTINESLCNSADEGQNSAIIKFELTESEQNLLKAAGYTINESCVVSW